MKKTLDKAIKEKLCPLMFNEGYTKLTPQGDLPCGLTYIRLQRHPARFLRLEGCKLKNS